MLIKMCRCDIISAMKSIEKNQIFRAAAQSYTHDAAGVFHVDGRAVFVPSAIAGEECDIRIVKVTKTAVYGRVENVISASAERRVSECPHFKRCGGCDTWHMSYDEELRFKLEKVNNAIRRIGGQNVTAREIIPCDNIYRYRNKAIFNLAQIDGKACFGFYRERSHQLTAIDDCLIQSELSCRAAKAVVDFMNARAIPAYDELNGNGSVRHIFCRTTRSGGAVLCIVSAKGFGAQTGELIDTLKERCLELSGIVLCVNKERGNTVLSGDFYTLWGEADIYDTLCGHSFKIAPRAFFQINPPQAEKLYNRAVEYACENKPKLIFELYCGAGTISLCLAERSEKVIAAEIVQDAVENANYNAAANGIDNVEFICADASQAAKKLLERGLKPDCVVVDPPRKGMDIEAIRATAAMGSERIVYVSCDSATLARDIKVYSELGYSLRELTAVDMFPRTSHVESVVLMSRVGAKQ